MTIDVERLKHAVVDALLEPEWHRVRYGEMIVIERKPSMRFDPNKTVKGDDIYSYSFHATEEHDKCKTQFAMLLAEQIAREYLK